MAHRLTPLDTAAAAASVRIVALATALSMLAAAAAASSTIYASATAAANFSWTNTGSNFSPGASAASYAAAGHELPESQGVVFLADLDKVYYVRANRPTTLLCSAHAVELEVLCAGEVVPGQIVQRQPMLPAADERPGRVGSTKMVIQVEVNVSALMVRRIFGEYRCECAAYLDSNRQRKVSSPSAVLLLAYLSRQFRREPLSTVVDILHPAELHCMAPDGVPEPIVSWQKNGEDIVPGANSKYIITHDGSLVINQARLVDEANYTCIARNELGMQKQTEPASLLVKVNGGWSSWSSWTRCDNPCSAVGGQQQQHRQRECRNPAPRHGGLQCEGAAVHAGLCSQACEDKNAGSNIRFNTGTGAAVGDLFWDEWSSWSHCNPDCQRYRKRTCKNWQLTQQRTDPGAPPGSKGVGSAAAAAATAASGCSGADSESSNCTEPCQVQNAPVTIADDREAMENIILYVSLCGAVALLAVILIVAVLCVMKRLSRRQAQDARADTAAASRAGSYSPGSEKAHQGTSGRQELAKTMIPMERTRPSVWQEPAASSTERVPMLPRSDMGGYYYASNACHVGSTAVMPPPPVPPPLPPRPGQPPAEDCSSSLSSGHESSGISDAYDRCSTASDRLLSNVDAQALCWSEVTHAGARLAIPGSGINLLIPEGALPKGSQEEAFIASLREDKDRPTLTESQTLLSPVLMCGPQDAPLQRTPVLTFDHCANLKSGQWKLFLYCSNSPYDTESPIWERLLTLANEQPGPSPATYCHLDAGQCHVMLTHLASRYCLVGESTYGGRALKQLKLVAFSAPLPSQAVPTETTSTAGKKAVLEHYIRVYVLPDTRDALQSVLHVEGRLGAKIIDKPKQLPFQDGAGSLCLAVDSIAPGWACKAAKSYQEIPFMHIWNGKENFPHCTLAFESMQDVCQSMLSCKLQAYQKLVPAGRQTLHIVCRAETLLKGQGHKGSIAGVSAGSAGSSSGCSSIVTLDGLPGSQMQQRHQQQLPALRLPPQLRAKLCGLLDPTQRKCSDWRMFCAAVGAEKQLNFFASRPSPTEAVLHLWEALRNDDAPISDLTSILRSIGRDDAASLVDREFKGSPWV